MDIPNHSNQSVSAGKTLCHQSILKRHQLAVFRREPDIFQVAKTLWWTHVIEYILLAICPISLFCIYAIYWSQT